MKAKLKCLQVVRGFAALMVIMVHAHVIITPPDKIELINKFKGYLGVPLFFILSGFIMVQVTEKQSGPVKKSIRDFLLKRIFRIVPLFYIALLLFFAINLYTPIGLLSFIKHNLNLMSRMLLFLPLFSDTWGPYYGIPLLYVSWSLNYELMFYELFALSFLFKRYRYVFLYAFFLITGFAVPLITTGNFTYNYGIYYNFKYGFFNFYTNPISFLFIIGVSFGLIIKRIKLSRVLVKIVSIVSILLFTAYLFSVIPGSSTYTDTLFCSLLFFSVILLDFNIPEIKPPKFLIYLGDISYSVYLMHPLVFMLLVDLTTIFAWHKIQESWYFLLFAYTVVIVVSLLAHEFIEKPVTLWLKKRFLHRGFRNGIV